MVNIEIAGKEKTMKPLKPELNSSCPMCGNVPGPQDILNDMGPFVWNGMMEKYICVYCNLELAIEFYEEESGYFERAARILGVDVWECRKRYLEDLVACDARRLAETGDAEDREILRWRMGSCERLLAAIRRFREAERGGDDHMELYHARQELKAAFAEKAFDAEVVLQGLIMVVVD
jgi:hypothetical protein